MKSNPFEYRSNFERIFPNEKNSTSNNSYQKAFDKNPLISIIVPVYNEVLVVEECNKRLNKIVDNLEVDTEIIYVNDGSEDLTLSILKNLARRNSRLVVVDLSRNFGKEIAVTAGLDHSIGDAVIIIDADLQDPPELIPKMIDEWKQGYDIVYMKRAGRDGETWMKKITSKGFYFLMNQISQVEMPQGVGDFRLLSRRAVDSLGKFRESTRYMKGLFAWLGYKKKEIIYDRDARYNGKSKWDYSSLWKLAVDGITSFSVAPLKLASYLGVFSFFLSMFLGVRLAINYLVSNTPPSSFELMVMGLIFFSGLQMILLGIIGSYLGRTYMETKKRPLYLINECIRSKQYSSQIHSLKKEVLG